MCTYLSVKEQGCQVHYYKDVRAKPPHQIGSQGTTKLLPLCASIRWTWLGTCSTGHYPDHSLNKPGSVQRLSAFFQKKIDHRV